mmetsp:Transcript_11780/g.35089  ORF Transcript_11780/g.35089 Transcript_11780/m.35089 type:complete len:176 (-) Transcript_11780:65-592(-)
MKTVGESEVLAVEPAATTATVVQPTHVTTQQIVRTQETPLLPEENAVNANELLIFSALCCVNSACYREADCCGCSGKVSVCCLSLEHCLKPGAPCLFPLCCLGIKCVSPTTLLKAQSQCCCLVHSAALPCDDEVPCMLSCCFASCWPRCGCLKTQAQLTGRPVDLVVERTRPLLA